MNISQERESPDFFPTSFVDDLVPQKPNGQQFILLQ